MNAKEEKKQAVKKAVLVTAYIAGCIGLTILSWKVRKKIIQKWALDAIEK